MLPFTKSCWLICALNFVELARSTPLASDCEDDISTSNCGQACTDLARIFPDKIVFPQDSSASKNYTFEQSEYWSIQQSSAAPACFITPETAQDVAIVVKTAKATRCPFAVKGGGHAAFAGASSIQDGVSIDMRKLNEVAPSEDDSIVRVGAGNRWENVYKMLGPYNLTVMGGRMGGVGVGGYLLGGGLAYFSGIYGLACDNVKNFEVVLADGTISDINQGSNPDLYWALRGGSNNFAVVTRYDLDAYPIQDFWAGSLVFNISEVDSLLTSYYNFGLATEEDYRATSWFAMPYMPALKQPIISMLPVYLDPAAVSAESTVPTAEAIFTNFTSTTPLVNDIKIGNVSRIAATADDDFGGFRNTWWAFTFKLNLEYMHIMTHRWLDWDKTLLTGLSGMNFQILSSHALEQTERRGGNPLGLKKEDGPLVIVNITPKWEDPASDAEIFARTQQFVEDAVKLAKEMDVWHQYVYLNYAAKEQGVLATYGEENFERLKSVSRKYDPEGVFQELWPGGHKLW